MSTAWIGPYPSLKWEEKDRCVRWIRAAWFLPWSSEVGCGQHWGQGTSATARLKHGREKIMSWRFMAVREGAGRKEVFIFSSFILENGHGERDKGSTWRSEVMVQRDWWSSLAWFCCRARTALLAYPDLPYSFFDFSGKKERGWRNKTEFRREKWNFESGWKGKNQALSCSKKKEGKKMKTRPASPEISFRVLFKLRVGPLWTHMLNVSVQFKLVGNSTRSVPLITLVFAL